MTSLAAKFALEGLRVFVVEDDPLIVMMMEEILDEFGCSIVGIAGTLSQAMRNIDLVVASADGAILDVNLGSGQDSYPFADALLEARVPFIFETGYHSDFLEPRFRQIPILPKPVQPEPLAAALAEFRLRDARPPRDIDRSAPFERASGI
jgi:two-component SAPR family response regulator